MSLVCRWVSIRTGSCLLFALLLMSEYCSAADEPQLGRLFTTKEQRQQLQQARARHSNAANRPPSSPAQAGSLSEAATGRTDEAPVVTLKGLIYKNDGAARVWVGTQHGATALDYRELPATARPARATAVRVPVAGKSVKLKPGQSYHPDSGAITELGDIAR